MKYRFHWGKFGGENMQKAIRNIKEYCENHQGELVYLVFSFYDISYCGETDEEYEEKIDNLSEEYENGFYKIDGNSFISVNNEVLSVYMYHNLIGDVYEVDKELIEKLVFYIMTGEENPLDNRYFREIYSECFERLAEYTDRKIAPIVREFHDEYKKRELEGYLKLREILKYQ